MKQHGTGFSNECNSWYVETNNKWMLVDTHDMRESTKLSTYYGELFGFQEQECWYDVSFYPRDAQQVSEFRL